MIKTLLVIAALFFVGCSSDETNVPVVPKLVVGKSLADLKLNDQFEKAHTLNEDTYRVIFALGIRYVGETVAKKLATSFKTIDNISSASYEELVEVDEIGERIANSVIAWFSKDEHKQIISELKNVGLNHEIDVSSENISNILDGKTFVVSGVFENHSRDELKALVENNGGKNTSSISSKTGYVIAGENMGPAKKAKAEKFGIPILSESDFIELISNN